MVSSQHLFRGHHEVVVGKVLIAANVVVYLLMTLTGGDPYRPAGEVARWGVLIGGGFTQAGPIGVAEGEWWRLVSGAFLHSGPIHLGMNMLLLWFLSQELEPALGRLNFALLYVVSLLGGSLGVMVIDPGVPTVGASGAVFGLMGALIVLQLRARQNPWKSGIGGLVLINLVLTFTIPGISLGGHVGGLLAGAAVGAVLQPLAWPQQGAALRSTVVFGFGVTFVALSIALASAYVA